MVKGVDSDKPLTSGEKQKIADAASAVDSFAWDSTTEGVVYWGEVYQKLLVISRQKGTCDSCGQDLPG